MQFQIFLDYTKEGSSFVFGNDLIENIFAFQVSEQVDPQPCLQYMWLNLKSNLRFMISPQALPIVIFFSSVMSVLYFLGLMQWLILKVKFVPHNILNDSVGPGAYCLYGNNLWPRAMFFFLFTQISWVMQITMGTSPTETLSVAGNIFVGQVLFYFIWH